MRQSDGFERARREFRRQATPSESQEALLLADGCVLRCLGKWWTEIDPDDQDQHLAIAAEQLAALQRDDVIGDWMVALQVTGMGEIEPTIVVIPHTWTILINLREGGTT